jgi:hypothetical protein
MKQLQLVFQKNHILIDQINGLYVYDTGSPESFSISKQNPFNDQEIGESHLRETDAKKLSEYLGIEHIVGLIGTDILNQYDHLIDLQTNTLTFSDRKLEHKGYKIALTLSDSLKGVPTLDAQIDKQLTSLIFDTGAQYSYYDDTMPTSSVPEKDITDFWPPIGKFKTKSFRKHIKLHTLETRVHFGVPPKNLLKLLNTLGAKGILGNEVMRNRVTGYFPRRNELVLQS